MRVLVFGGRKYKDKKKVFQTLTAIHNETPIRVIIHGGASGADRFAKWWGEGRRCAIEEYKADWDNMQADVVVPRQHADGRWYNAAAGNLRNALMLRKSKPDMVVEFPGGSGTADMRALVKQEKKRRELRHIVVGE